MPGILASGEARDGSMQETFPVEVVVFMANAKAENVTLHYHFEWLWEQTQHSLTILIQQMI